MKLPPLKTQLVQLLGRLLTCLLFSLVLLADQSHAEIGKAEFESIQGVSNYILNKYPRDQYLYLGIGSSPTPVIAYLKTENETMVRNLPLASFRYGVSRSPEFTGAQLSRASEDLLYTYMDYFIPNVSELGERKNILLIDFAFRGTTLVSAEIYLNRYLKSRGRNIQTQTLGITQALKAAEMKKRSNFSEFQKMDLFILPSNSAAPMDNTAQNDPFYVMMLLNLYRDIAEYSGFRLDSPVLFTPRKEYANYVEEMLRVKNGDPARLDNVWISTLKKINDFQRNLKRDAEPELAPALTQCAQITFLNRKKQITASQFTLYYKKEISKAAQKVRTKSGLPLYPYDLPALVSKY